jgi:hypothetical protein
VLTRPPIVVIEVSKQRTVGGITENGAQRATVARAMKAPRVREVEYPRSITVTAMLSGRSAMTF